MINEIFYLRGVDEGRGHVAAKLHVGNSRSKLIDVLTQLPPFIGYPRSRWLSSGSVWAESITEDILHRSNWGVEGSGWETCGGIARTPCPESILQSPHFPVASLSGLTLAEAYLKHPEGSKYSTVSLIILTASFHFPSSLTCTTRYRAIVRRYLPPWSVS
jgi:hypothetical protein